ncbi:MAG: hypothetical protein HY019_01500 [Aquabacterium sp.]|uniref:hypothetical protein n=1 Tax=Aquabacterium sp. TaxID=1872578 RepID=UPI0025C1E0EB|nr:hypothetical protein [Aquabacterium sp.]MBI3380657.1 hypothetical protein [Aquabacterium sp.]
MSKRNTPSAPVLTQEAPPATPTWSVPLLRAHKIQTLAGQLMGAALRNQVGTATLLPMRLDASLWQEMLAIQQDVARRCGQQQQAWVDGCKGLGQAYSQLTMAQTLTQFVEQEHQLADQFNALVASQLAGWADLMQTIQLDYADWLAQKQAQAPSAGSLTL